MFKSDGPFEGPVKDVVLAEPRFPKGDPNAFDVAILVEGPEGQSGWWYGEMSSEYGQGNMKDKRQSEITMGDLRKVGFEGNDLTDLNRQLVGQKIPFYVKAREHNSQTYYDVKYIGGANFGPQAVKADELSRRMAAMMGGGTVPTSAAATTTQGAADAGKAASPWD